MEPRLWFRREAEAGALAPKIEDKPMKKSLLLSIALLLIGCANTPRHPVALNDDHISNAAGLSQSVRADLATPPVTEPIRTSAIQRLDSVKAELSAATQDDHVRNVLAAKQADEIVKDQTEIKAYQGRWLGDKLFQFFRRILAIVSILVVAAIGLSIWGAVGTGALAGIAGKVGTVALHGLPFVGAGINWVIAKFTSPKVATPVVANKE